MITREDLNGKTGEEITKLLEADIAEYTALVDAIETEEELLDKEKDLMLIMDEYEAYMKNVEYELDDRCTFDGQEYTKKAVFDKIISFLDNQELAWEHVYGVYNLIKIWKNKDVEKISYGAYDSTLRILKTLKYRGFENWKSIQTINEYLSNCHLEYARDTSYIIYVSKLHNAVIDAQEKFHPKVKQVNEDANNEDANNVVSL